MLSRSVTKVSTSTANNDRSTSCIAAVSEQEDVAIAKRSNRGSRAVSFQNNLDGLLEIVIQLELITSSHSTNRESSLIISRTSRLLDKSLILDIS